jgi:hypothetical protein
MVAKAFPAQWHHGNAAMQNSYSGLDKMPISPANLRPVKPLRPADPAAAL